MEKSLAEALAAFDEDQVMKMIKKRLEAGETAVSLIHELQHGMGLVGERFEAGKYFLSELIMSADLFSRVMALLEPELKGQSTETLGRIVIGTPKGDIHDIGKNIFCTVAKGAGFEVHDLGVDVSVDQFVTAVEDLRPQILGFSALITTTFEKMKSVVDKLIEKNLRDQIKVIVGGGVTTDMVQKYVGADAQTIDAIEGLNFCKGFLHR